MNKKIVYVIICVIIILIVVGIIKNSDNQEEINNTNNENISTENVNVLEENEENNVSNLTETQEKSDSTTSSTTSKTNETTETSSSAETIIAQVSPVGFMGSSLYRVVLYGNGNVYVQRFDGNGTEEENIVSSDLIAQNVSSIKIEDDEESEFYGEVIVQGGEVLDTDFGWIEFTNGDGS